MPLPQCCHGCAGSAPERLFWHTLVALVIFLTGVASPVLLLLHKDVGPICFGAGIALLAVGSGAFIGAAIARGIDSTTCSPLQFRLMLTAAWVLNPVVVVVISAALNQTEVGWWSGLPLCAVLVLLSGRIRLTDGGPRWDREDCPWGPWLIMYWVCNRLVFIGGPLYFLSFQVTLYLPYTDMLPAGEQVGLFVCGGLLITCIKFCAMCNCLAPSERPGEGITRLPQAFVLLLMLGMDWISMVKLIAGASMNDDTKEILMLLPMLLAGLILFRVALVRLQLRSRWKRACQQRRARSVGHGQDLELGAELSASSPGLGQGESSDSEDDRGPGSVPTGFHEALMSVLGFPEPEARREWLCGPRRAVVGSTAPQGGPPVVPPLPLQLLQQPQPQPGDTFASAESGNASAPAPPTASLEIATPSNLNISPDERVCTICQEQIHTGERVRPMPKCAHVYHAACLEGWAKVKQEKTRCPTCRRPALQRKQTDGATHIDSLSSDAGQVLQAAQARRDSRRSSTMSTTSQGSRPGSRRTASDAGSRRPALAGAGPRRPARAVRSSTAVADLRALLGISEMLAEVALDISSGVLDEAAALVLEHAAFLQQAAFREATAEPVTPATGGPGVAEAVVQANPNLEGMLDPVRRHLRKLLRVGRIPPRATWASMTPTQHREVLRALLNDVAEAARSRAGRAL